jgi:Domain of unknown function (DUF6265)
MTIPVELDGGLTCLRPAALLAVLALAMLACGGAGSPAPSEVSDPLAEVAWLEGRWETAPPSEPSVEHWVRVDDALIGVSFSTRAGRTAAFEVLTISRRGGGLVYDAMPDGRRRVEFRMSERGDRSATFANPEHDFPRALHYRREGDTLSARLVGQGEGALEFAWRLGAAGAAAELEAADRARATGREPVASGLSPAGDVGYTVGRERASARVTIWRRQDGGTWLVAFDRALPE